MSILSVYHQSTPDTPNKVLTHADDIAATLAEQGVHFEQRELLERIRPGTAHEEVIDALRGNIDTLIADFGVGVVEVLSVHAEHPQKDELRAGLIDERRHASRDVRFVASGRGLLNMRIGEYVYALVAERTDLVSLPAGTAQWSDIGEQPQLVMLRLFETEEGCKPQLVSDDSARLYPGLDDTF